MTKTNTSSTSTSTGIHRRELLKSAGAVGALIAIGGGGISLFDTGAAWAEAAPGDGTDTVIVTVFLRGALDGLSLVAPTNATDPEYAVLRPNLNVSNPFPAFSLYETDGRQRFLLHGGATGLAQLWEGGELAIVHAAGIPDNAPRSHFMAMDQMDRALGGGAASGWLRSALEAELAPVDLDPWSAVGVGASPNVSIASATDGAAPTIPSIDQIVERRLIDPVRRDTYGELYSGTRYMPLWQNGLASTDMMVNVQQQPPPAAPYYDPADPANQYPYDVGASRLGDAARMINADVGIRAIAIDTGSWDTHQNQVNDLKTRIGQLSESLFRFWADLNEQSHKRTIVLVMSEFGRTVHENGGQGTEHGSGNCMLVIGSPERVNGGRFHLKDDEWPGLTVDKLRDGQDLMVTTDFRDVFAEVIEAQFGRDAVTAALPNHDRHPVGLFKPTGPISPTITAATAGQFGHNPSDPAIHLSWDVGLFTPGSVDSIVQVRLEGATWNRYGVVRGSATATDYEVYKEKANTGLDDQKVYEVRVAWRMPDGTQSAWATATVGPWP